MVNRQTLRRGVIQPGSHRRLLAWMLSSGWMQTNSKESRHGRGASGHKTANALSVDGIAGSSIHESPTTRTSRPLWMGRLIPSFSSIAEPVRTQLQLARSLRASGTPVLSTLVRPRLEQSRDTYLTVGRRGIVLPTRRAAGRYPYPEVTRDGLGAAL